MTMTSCHAAWQVVSVRDCHCSDGKNTQLLLDMGSSAGWHGQIPLFPRVGLSHSSAQSLSDVKGAPGLYEGRL